MELLFSESFFETLANSNFIYIVLLLIISFALLCKGADWFVEGSVGIAKRFGIPKIVIGATIVSMGTTSAEVAVSVMAAFNGQSGIALGNGIGSVICDTALIFGLCCCIVKLPKDKFILNRHGWIQFVSGIGFAFICYILYFFKVRYIDYRLGIVMFLCLIAYILYTVKWSKQHSRDSGVLVEMETVKGKIPIQALLFVLGLICVIIGSRLLIGSVNQICLRCGIPESVVAATLVAFGTSLPELATAIASIKKGHKEILLGNILGADILNILLVIGVASFAGKLEIDSNFYTLHFPALITILLLFRLYVIFSKNDFKKWFGYPLLLIYFIYIYIQYFVF